MIAIAPALSGGLSHDHALPARLWRNVIRARRHDAVGRDRRHGADAVDLADALGSNTFAAVGHDWGARIAYALAAAAPERVTRIATLSVGWDPARWTRPASSRPAGIGTSGSWRRSAAPGCVRERGKAFARYQWETWRPPHWFDDTAFETTAKSFENRDWPAITLHSYRVRRGEAEPDRRYSELDARVRRCAPSAHPL